MWTLLAIKSITCSTDLWFQCHIMYSCAAVLFDSSIWNAWGTTPEHKQRRQIWWRNNSPLNIQHRHVIIAAAWRVHREGVQLERLWHRGTKTAEWGWRFLSLFLTASKENQASLLEWKKLTWELTILCNSVHHCHSYHPVAMPTAFKSCLPWHSAWFASPPPPLLP